MLDKEDRNNGDVRSDRLLQIRSVAHASRCSSASLDSALMYLHFRLVPCAAPSLSDDSSKTEILLDMHHDSD